jgi:hypothetical protein
VPLPPRSVGVVLAFLLTSFIYRVQRDSFVVIVCKHLLEVLFLTTR